MRMIINDKILKMKKKKEEMKLLFKKEMIN
jgi:hypothetical protein